MICIPADIPQSLCDIDDERKDDISQQRHCVYLGFLKQRNDRNKFVNDTAGMLKSERENHYEEHFI